VQGERIEMTQKRPHDRSRAGFTMMELMGAVAIIAIIMAVAFPAAASIQANLRVMELNAKAQQVYNQAQSRLTSLQTDGTLSDLESKLGSGTSRQLASAPVAPAAYSYGDGLTTDWSKYGMYQLSSTISADKTIISDYLITGDTSLGASAGLTGNYVIELSPSTGEVYAVYYWEGDAPSSGYITYDTVASQTTDQLKANHIGYYGGKPIDPAITHKSVALFDDLGFSLVNKEELYARIISSDFSKTVFDPSKLSVTIKVTGTPSSFFSTGSWSETFQGGDSPDEFKVNASTNEVDIILDSMREDLDFYTITGGQILPGSDIKVSVSVTYNGNTYDASNRTGMQTKSDNSLFGTGSFALTASTTANVSAVRHLNNLRSQRNGLSWSLAKVSQTGDIDFDGADWTTTPECVSVQSRKAQSDNSWNPLTQFTPIDNAYYNNNWGGRTFDGASHKIKNFNIVGDSYTGLFPTSYLDFTNVFMTDTNVSGVAYSGALSGWIHGGSITNCHNEVTKTDANGKLLLDDYGVTSKYGWCVGGLVGRYSGGASTTIANCSATTDVTSTYGMYVGGLIGWVDAGGTKITGCSVGAENGVVSVSGYGNSIGGLVGQHDSGLGEPVLSGCSAFANVTSTAGSFVGGLVGYLSNGGSAISKCTVGSENSPVSVTAFGNQVGGIVGLDNGGPSPVAAIDGCTAFASVTSKNGVDVGGLAGQITSNGAVVSNCNVGSAKTVVSMVGPNSAVGGLIGQSFAKSVTGCHVVANASGKNRWVGGLIGDQAYTSVIIDDCSVGVGAATPVLISGAIGAGGLCGIFQGKTITNCSVVANVVATGKYAGGLCGYTETSTQTISNCSVGSSDVLLQVSGAQLTGGAIGHCAGGTISNCKVLFTNVLSNSERVGGFIGELLSGTVSGCYAIGNPDYNNGVGQRSTVQSTGSSSSIGGFYGYAAKTTTTGCYTDMNVLSLDANMNLAGSYVGGFVGFLDGSSGEIGSCYASGQVQGGATVGGFAGGSRAVNIHDCFATGNVLGNSSTGGFFGSLSSSLTYSNDIAYGLVRNANGNVPGTGYYGGFVGTYTYADASRLSGCTYLSYAGYNENISSTTAAYQPAGKSYSALKVSNPTTETHPYLATLKGKAFPFAMVGGLPYYGDWPAESYHVTFKNGAGTTLYETDVAPGVTPSYLSTSPSPDYVVQKGTVKVLMLWNGSWAPGIVAASSDATYTAQYSQTIAYPDPAYLLEAGGTTYTPSTGNASKELWKFLASNGKNTTDAHSIDSEAPYTTGLGNAATSVRAFLYANGFYTAGAGTDAPVVPSDFAYSWRLHVNKNVYCSYQGSLNGISTSNANSYENNFVIYLGQKISGAQTGLQVVKYDVGRASKGLPAYQHGTISSVLYTGNNTSYYIYDESTYVATSGWGSLG
jgi:prepilin-type N-terminal cleavage/methylation domain-containing protein